MRFFFRAKKLAEISAPEILRIPLDQFLLQTFAITSSLLTDGGPNKNNGNKESSGYSFEDLLSHCIDPPSSSALNSAFHTLLQLQAIVLPPSPLSDQEQSSTSSLPISRTREA